MTSQESPDSHQEILLERYQVQQELGKKAGRRSLLARDLQTQELVVVKILSFGNEFEWNDLKLFEREAETLKALSYQLFYLSLYCQFLLMVTLLTWHLWHL